MARPGGSSSYVSIIYIIKSSEMTLFVVNPTNNRGANNNIVLFEDSSLYPLIHHPLPSVD